MGVNLPRSCDSLCSLPHWASGVAVIAGDNSLMPPATPSVRAVSRTTCR